MLKIRKRIKVNSSIVKAEVTQNDVRGFTSNP